MFTLNSCVLKGFVHPFAESADLYALFLFFFGICIDCSCDRRIFIRSEVSDLFVGANGSGNGNLSCEEEGKKKRCSLNRGDDGNAGWKCGDFR